MKRSGKEPLKKEGLCLIDKKVEALRMQWIWINGLLMLVT